MYNLDCTTSTLYIYILFLGRMIQGRILEQKPETAAASTLRRRKKCMRGFCLKL